jgi:hypothetical protein
MSATVAKFSFGFTEGHSTSDLREAEALLRTIR